MSVLLGDVDTERMSVQRMVGHWGMQTYLVCSMTTLKGMRGIQVMKHINVKMAKIKKTIPPDQYFLDSM